MSKNVKTSIFIIALVVAVILASSFRFHSLSTVLLEDSKTYKSEYRGIFIHSSSYVGYQNGPNYEVIAETVKDLGINVICVEIGGNNYLRYTSNVIPAHTDRNDLQLLVDAAHKYGLEAWVSFNVMLSAYTGDGVERRAVDANGEYVNWLCPTNPASRDLLKREVQEIASYDIDAFVFDYIRYETREMCFCEHCKQRFIEDTGLTDVNWPSDVLEGGRYSQQFVEWRIKPINELVKLIREWMLEVNPDLKFGAATWRWLLEAPQYWRYWIGQDATYWVKEGWLDFVCPMIYTDDVSQVEAFTQSVYDIMTGGPEGIIPYVPFIDTCVDSISTPENFQQRIAKLKELDADGWLVWKYGGPGDNGDGPDFTQYVDASQLDPILEISNIKVRAVSNDSVEISWSTNIPATGKVEIASQPFFTYSLSPSGTIDYWDVTYTPGQFYQEQTKTTSHSIIIRGLTPNTKYYFRVQSTGSGTATSEVLSFVFQPSSGGYWSPPSTNQTAQATTPRFSEGAKQFNEYLKTHGLPYIVEETTNISQIEVVSIEKVNDTLEITVNGTGIQQFRVFCGDWGIPNRIEGAANAIYDEASKTLLIEVIFQSPVTVRLEWVGLSQIHEEPELFPQIEPKYIELLLFAGIVSVIVWLIWRKKRKNR